MDFEPLSKEEICLLSEKLGRNKSVGADDVPAEVYKHGFPTLFRVIACLFNKMLSNTFLPSELMKILFVPKIKNKTLISSDSRNCRPIALLTAASKLIELILQKRMSPYIYTSDAQFGFKAYHGIGMAMFSFEESVKIYMNSGSLVFVYFLDVTKAFDRVNHTKLFNNLRTRKIPEY